MGLREVWHLGDGSLSGTDEPAQAFAQRYVKPLAFLTRTLTCIIRSLCIGRIVRSTRLNLTTHKPLLVNLQSSSLITNPPHHPTASFLSPPFPSLVYTRRTMHRYWLHCQTIADSLLPNSKLSPAQNNRVDFMIRWQHFCLAAVVKDRTQAMMEVKGTWTGSLKILLSKSKLILLHYE